MTQNSLSFNSRFNTFNKENFNSFQESSIVKVEFQKFSIVFIVERDFKYWDQEYCVIGYENYWNKSLHGKGHFTRTELGPSTLHQLSIRFCGAFRSLNNYKLNPNKFCIHYPNNAHLVYRFPCKLPTRINWNLNNLIIEKKCLSANCVSNMFSCLTLDWGAITGPAHWHVDTQQTILHKPWIRFHEKIELRSTHQTESTTSRPTTRDKYKPM